ncbi:hypothetical protein [Vibrio parahaemolyticus]|uniref:hypothetical protein n=1 Tax=Vibrio parahaemolyticus TaxID=670 RepID=UPI0007A05C34|nr:hypothetical protein [Vibrio parahaemolyticus]EGQ7678895.1 hypothetical protein [Vibrio parahaemolyticus]EGQ9221757.1 hypothetical protein [Vibrio parahaemolyticus]ELA7276211.1 hypothetical protein [Vibrio parahaemolyticus]ELA7280963.1 hypothetical protein [Vibrio parahaemolyticus]ELA7343224.1 hypothetical protein [Vibrio parahaemolyticus]
MKTSVKDIVKSILDIFTHNVDEQQVLKDQMFDFFLVFSRFECALKETGYISAPGSNASPDWNRFVSAYKENFDVTSDILESYEYLTNEATAPNRQKVTSDSSYEWKPQTINVNAPKLVLAVDSIKLVRNNLFHGGKYGDETWGDYERNIHLMSHSISLLFAMKELDSDIAAIFENFA